MFALIYVGQEINVFIVVSPYVVFSLFEVHILHCVCLPGNRLIIYTIHLSFLLYKRVLQKILSLGSYYFSATFYSNIFLLQTFKVFPLY